MLSGAPVLVFGGPYSNLEATQAVLAEAARRGVPPENVICTGDVVAYCADAKACVDLVRAAGIQVIAGNCEEQIAAGEADCGCGFAPGSDCDLASRTWFAHACRSLDDNDRAWMAGLAPRFDFEINGLHLVVIHATSADNSRFVFASTPARIKALDLDRLGVDGIICGHSGLPFTQAVEGRLWHNPGVVGMPANDGTPRVWFSVLSPGAEPGALTIEHAALTYDCATAATKMRAALLPEDYALALSTGLWPNCEILPSTEAKVAGQPLEPATIEWRRAADNAAWPYAAPHASRDPSKFQDAHLTAAGDVRAIVGMAALRTLWINTGTTCNLSCARCYIESTPKNDRLAYISAKEVAVFFDEIQNGGFETETIGFTGGEPFVNPDMIAMLDDALSRGFEALVLTNAMKPMQRHARRLDVLRSKYPEKLTLRVSLDHYTPELHELERGPRTWRPAIDGLKWLGERGFRIAVAGRMYSGEAEPVVRAGYARLFNELSIALDAQDPASLVLFPEMDEQADVPEITESCWDILGKRPADVMCASSRMVVKRKGAVAPTVLACTLIAYDEAFELGRTLASAIRPIALNHPHCAKFCVLGGASCSVESPAGANLAPATAAGAEIVETN
ncbi:MAG: radical SAM protein [Beijerinckiaceae bacterium]